MHLPRYESRGGRLRKTATSPLYGLNTFALTAPAIARVIAILNSRDCRITIFKIINLHCLLVNSGFSFAPPHSCSNTYATTTTFDFLF